PIPWLVTDTERAARCHMLPPAPSQLVITLIIDVVDVFEVASHGSTSVRVSRPVTVLSREQIRQADRKCRIVSPHRLVFSRENRRNVSRRWAKIIVGISDGGQSIREIGANLIPAAPRYVTQRGAPRECKAGAVFEITHIRFPLEVGEKSHARLDLGHQVMPTACARAAHAESKVGAA